MLPAGLGGSVVLCFGPRELAWGAQLLAVRVAGLRLHPGHAGIGYRTPRRSTFAVPNPDRLVIDVEGLELNHQLKDLVRKVRTTTPTLPVHSRGANRPKVARLVIDPQASHQTPGFRPGAGRGLTSTAWCLTCTLLKRLTHNWHCKRPPAHRQPVWDPCPTSTGSPSCRHRGRCSQHTRTSRPNGQRAICASRQQRQRCLGRVHWRPQTQTR